MEMNKILYSSLGSQLFCQSSSSSASSHVPLQIDDVGAKIYFPENLIHVSFIIISFTIRKEEAVYRVYLQGQSDHHVTITFQEKAFAACLLLAGGGKILCS